MPRTRRIRNARRSSLVAPVVLTPLLLLSACGGDATSTDASATASATASASAAEDDDGPAGGGGPGGDFTEVELDNEGANAEGANTAEVVTAAEAFLASLTEEQRTAANLELSDNLSRQTWSNFPTTFVERKGVALADLSEESQTAALALVDAMSSDEGLSQIEQVRQSDAWLSENSSGDTSGFGADLYYIAIYGTPSATDPFMLQFGGHHLARNYTYEGTTASVTPSFTGTEPKTFELDGTTYEPMKVKADAIVAAFATLSAEQDAQAKLSTDLDDILMGPNADSGEFPATEGLPVSELSAQQQQAVLTAVQAWVDDAEDGVAASLLETYTSQLDQTTIAYSTTTTADGESAYFRIDGPRAFIELINTRSMSTDDVHWHGVYRDKEDDYGSSNPST